MEVLFWVAVIFYILLSVFGNQSKRSKRQVGPTEQKSPSRPSAPRPWDPLGGPFGPSGPWGEPWPPLPEPAEGPYGEGAEPEVEPVAGPTAPRLPEPDGGRPRLPAAAGPGGTLPPAPPVQPAAGAATWPPAPGKADRWRELLASGPLDRESVVLGIVFEEILRPPRCRRRWRPIYRGED